MRSVPSRTQPSRVPAAPPCGRAAESPGVRAADARAAKKELARLERQIGKLEQREAQLHDQLAGNATDYEKVAVLDAELRAVQAERQRTEAEWLELAEAMG